MVRRRFVRALLAAPLAVFLGGITAPGSSSAATPSNWMISATAIGLINGYTGNTTLTTQAFDVASTVEIGTPAKGWVSQRAATYTAYGPDSLNSSFLYALKYHLVPQGTHYVMLDLESWSLTPLVEQLNPAVYMQEFVSTAHQHKYKAILAPSLDLTKNMACHNSSDPLWKNYLMDCSVPQMVAEAGPDVFEVQSQSLEADTSTNIDCGCYAWFVDQAVSQSRAVVPTLDVRAGLSTNPNGQLSTGQTLYTDTVDTEAAVDGYWLNVPAQSTACPNCLPGGAPQVAASYLELLGYKS